MGNQSFSEIALGTSFSRELTRRHLNKRYLSPYSQPLKGTLHYDYDYDLLSAAVSARISHSGSHKSRNLPAHHSQSLGHKETSTNKVQLTVAVRRIAKSTRHKPYPTQPAKHARRPSRPRRIALHPLHCDCDYCYNMEALDLSKWITSAIHEYLFVDGKNRAERIR